MPKHWYYAVREQRSGPVDLEALKDLIRSGRLDAQTLVWKEGLPKWIPAGEVPELRLGAQPPTLPASPEPPPLPTRSSPGRKTFRFEADHAASPAPPPRVALPHPTSTVPPQASRPSRPALKVTDAVIAPFLLVGAIGLAVVAGMAGSMVGNLVFIFVALVCAMAFWVRVSIFLYKGWGALPWKFQVVKPGLAAASPWIPLANLALIFRAVHGLSVKTNEALVEKGQKAAAPEALGIGVGVGFVLMLLLPLAIPNPGVLLYFNTAVIALTAHWLVLQSRASNILIGHMDAPTPALGLRIGVLASGGLALLLALILGAANLHPSSQGLGAPDTANSPAGIWGSSGPGSPELLDLARQEARRNAAFAEQLRNIRSAYSGGRIQWRYPPQDESEAQLRRWIEQEAARNRAFVDQLQQIRESNSSPGLYP